MIHYELVTGPDAPSMAGAEVDALEAEGYERKSPFRASLDGRPAFAGEILVDGDGTTAAAAYLSLGRMSVALHSELEDGTYIVTEQRPPALMYLFLQPGLAIPLPGTSLRFPAVRDTRELVAKHRAHVAEVSRARASAVARTMSTARYVELRHREQGKRKPQRDFQGKAAFGSLFAGVVAAAVHAAFAFRGGQAGLPSTVAVVSVLAFLLPVVTYLFLAPWMMRLGIGPKAGAGALAPPAVAKSQAIGVVRLHDPSRRAMALQSFVMAAGVLSAVFSLVSTLQGGAVGWQMLVLPLLAASWTNAFVDLLLRRKISRPTEATLRVEGGQVLGPRVALDVAHVSGCVVTRAATPTLMAFDERGRVVLRAEGDAATLGPLARAIAPARERFPLEHRVVRLAAAIVGAPLAAALCALALGAPRASVLATGAVGLALGPLLQLGPRSALEIGIDGLLLEPVFGRKTFVAFSEIAELKVETGALVIAKKDGTVRRAHLAVTDTAEKAIEAWRAHGKRAEERDEAKAVRRRVAVDETEAPTPYRVGQEDTEGLVDAVLDSAENRSVRIRAARKLAMRSEDDAALARAEAEERIADPDVARELRGSRDDD